MYGVCKCLSWFTCVTKLKFSSSIDLLYHIWGLGLNVPFYLKYSEVINDPCKIVPALKYFKLTWIDLLFKLFSWKGAYNTQNDLYLKQELDCESWFTWTNWLLFEAIFFMGILLFAHWVLICHTELCIMDATRQYWLGNDAWGF